MTSLARSAAVFTLFLTACGGAAPRAKSAEHGAQGAQKPGNPSQPAAPVAHKAANYPQVIKRLMAEGMPEPATAWTPSQAVRAGKAFARYGRKYPREMPRVSEPLLGTIFERVVPLKTIRAYRRKSDIDSLLKYIRAAQSIIYAYGKAPGGETAYLAEVYGLSALVLSASSEPFAIRLRHNPRFVPSEAMIHSLRQQAKAMLPLFANPDPVPPSARRQVIRLARTDFLQVAVFLPPEDRAQLAFRLRDFARRGYLRPFRKDLQAAAQAMLHMVFAGPGARVRPASPQVIRAISRVVSPNMSKFGTCYEAGKRKNPRLNGLVVVSLRVDSLGKVSALSHRGSTLSDSAVKECIAKEFGKLSFPGVAGGVQQIVFPLLFAPKRRRNGSSGGKLLAPQ